MTWNARLSTNYECNPFNIPELLPLLLITFYPDFFPLKKLILFLISFFHFLNAIFLKQIKTTVRHFCGFDGEKNILLQEIKSRWYFPLLWGFLHLILEGKNYFVDLVLLKISFMQLMFSFNIQMLFKKCKLINISKSVCFPFKNIFQTFPDVQCRNT